MVLINLARIFKMRSCVYNLCSLSYYWKTNRAEIYFKFNRNFNIPTRVVREKYVEYENIFAHEVLENKATYKGTVIIQPLKCAAEFNEKININNNSVYKFYQCSINNLEKKNILDNDVLSNNVKSVVKHIPLMEFSDIQLMLFSLCLWPVNIIHYDEGFKFLWNKLDQECSRRLKNWSIDQKLLIADHFFHLYLSRISTYSANMILNVINDCDKLTCEQFVHLTFLMMLQKCIPQSMFNKLMPKCEKVIELISIEELSVVCLGYFKNDAKISNLNILRLIISRTVSEINTLDSLTYIRIIKFLRKSFQDHIIQCYVPLVEACIKPLRNWDLFASVHTALLCSKSFIFEPSLLYVIIEKLKENIDSARIKDISKILQCLSQFNYMSHFDFHNVLFEEIKKPHRLKEMKEFPIEMLNILIFCAYMGRYQFNIIEYIFSSDFVEFCQNTRDGQLLERLAVVDFCVEIECENYKGPRLKSSLLQVLTDSKKLLMENIENKNNIVLSVNKKILNSLSTIISPNDFALYHTLPHMFNSDIIVRLKSKQTIPLEEIISSYKGDLLKPPSDELWGCLVTCGPFSFPYKSKRLCGLITMKQRHLQKLGYKVVLIPYKEIPFYEGQRKLYLKQKLNSLHDTVESHLNVNVSS